jgi:hypothetical protein
VVKIHNSDLCTGEGVVHRADRGGLGVSVGANTLDYGGPRPPTSKKWVFVLPRSDDASPPTGFDFVQSLVGDEVEVGSELLEQGVLGAGAGD